MYFKIFIPFLFFSIISCGLSKSTKENRTVLKMKDGKNAYKFIGFKGYENKKDRLNIDKDTALLLLKPKPIYVMPLIIKDSTAKKRHNHLEMVNQFFV